MRRKILGVSQERLAEDLGLTFQQSAEVRARRQPRQRSPSCTRSPRACSRRSPTSSKAWPTPTDGDGIRGKRLEQFVHDFLMTPEGLELAALFPRIGKSKGASAHPGLVRSMAEDLIEEESDD
jgi:hypothetical protein